LKVGYTASSGNIVKNYLNENNEPIDSFTIWDSYWDIGSPNQHMQQLVINYEIPLIKSHYLALLRLIIPIRVITIGRNHQMHFLS
jgi:hypothetical protein